MAQGRVLVVDDDDAVALVLQSLLKQAGHRVARASSGAEALEVFAARSFDVVITDLRMPKMDGMELLRRLKTEDPELPVVMLTAHGSVETAVEAMKRGAADFLGKPFDRDEVLFTVDKALQGRSDAPPAPEGEHLLLGASEAMATCRRRIAKAARSDATVLVRGESGTGKELAARSIHAESERAAGPFVAVNCAALPDQLLESELFGYEKGAFTGAVQNKPGRVEIARGGTLFLDEIGDVSPAVQVKLLRLLQERTFEPLGATKPRDADVRFVAATHRDLGAMIEDGDFREDLFYRLDVIPLTMPPLRNRPGDIPALAQRFVREVGERHRISMSLADDAAAALVRFDWPGNVRQLQNLCERLVVLGDGDVITGADIARELERALPTSSRPAPSSGEVTLEQRRAEAEVAAVREALARTEGNRTRAARLLGISRRKLYYLLDEHGLADAG